MYVARTQVGWRALTAALFVVALGLVTPPPASAQEPSARATLFEGARLIRGDGTQPIENSAFLVRGDRIVKVGRRGDVVPPADATRIDLTGKTVIPMMMTLHTHPGVLKGVVMSSKFYSKESLHDSLRRFAYYGFSAVGSPGVEPGEVPYEVRDESRTGYAILRTAGRGFGWPNEATGVPAINDVPYGVTTAQEARAKAQELVAHKPNFVKIWVDDRNGKYHKLTPELYRPIIEEAHKGGIPVVAHVYYLSDAHDLVDSGVQGFLHLTRDMAVDEGLVQKMKANNVWVTPNIFVHARTELYREKRPAWLADPELLATMAPEVVEQLATTLFSRDGKLLPMAGVDDPIPMSKPGSTYSHLKESVAKLNRAGVDIVLGPDTGTPGSIYGFSELCGMETLVDAGMTPMEVIVAATARPARIMGLYDLGSLVENKTASFVVLNKNPLDDIRNIRRIADVYQNGVRLDRSAMSAELIKSSRP